MSQILSELNEIILPQIARGNGGTVIVAGGGKFTSKFDSEDKAKAAKEKIVKAVSPALPMLEFQISVVVSAPSLKEAKSIFQ